MRKAALFSLLAVLAVVALVGLTSKPSPVLQPPAQMGGELQ